MTPSINRLFSLAAGGLAAYAILAASGALAAQQNEKDRIMSLKGIEFASAKTLSIEREDSPAILNSKGETIDKVPPRTVVKLLLNPAKGSNINVQIWLPDQSKWNGKLLGLGNGGAAGGINPGIFVGPLTKGYASASTDMGTAPNSDSGIGNREVWKDFGYRATHLTTLCAKQAVEAFYGRKPELSYFVGGSTGGQQALQEAQRYPEDYDGIVSGIPAHCRAPLHAYFLWNEQILHRRPFTEAQQANVIAAANEFMASREAPQAAGSFVSDPRCDAKEVETVVQLALKKDSSLTPEHAEALRKLFDGPRDAKSGERIFNGIPLGSSFDLAKGHLYLFRWVFGPKKDLMEIDFGDEVERYLAELGPYLNAESPDLSAFEARGGKLLMYSGSADSCVPYHATMDYYERAIARCGSLERTKGFFRFFIVPGMAHGPSGPGINKIPDMLELVAKWREKGEAPESLRGQRVVEGKTLFEIPVYAYPLKAVWDETAGAFKPVEGPRGGAEPVAGSFLPPAKD